MSTIVALKNPNGFVIAGDSRVTFGGCGSPTYFDNYHKINQIGELPILTGMWGSGTIQGKNVPTLLAEFWHTRFRGRLPKSWTVQEIAAALLEFLKEQVKDPKNTTLNMLVGGYSSRSFYPDLYELSTSWEAVNEVSKGNNSIIVWRGVTDGIRTLWWGYGPDLDKVLENSGITEENVRKAVINQMEKNWAWGPQRMAFNMPIEDAAQLCKFLVDVEIFKQKFWPGPARTAPPVDVAAVTVNGVRWFARKEGAY